MFKSRPDGELAMCSGSTHQIKPRESATLQMRRRVGHITNSLFDRWMEWRLGVSTGGHFNIAANTGLVESYHDYWPISYRALRAAMRRLHVNPGVDVFVDYGAGRGRATIMAAMYPFRRIIGIEIVESLANSARDNHAHVAWKMRCRDTQIIHCDATQYQLPDDATVIHFFNPFSGEVLSRTMDQIERSFLAAPRDLKILFANPEHFESLLRERSWQLSREDVIWPGCPSPGPNANRYRSYILTGIIK